MSSESEARLRALREGDLEVKGEFLWGSNYTFLAQLTFEGQQFPVVYKPTRGERPLWDFPAASLGRREAAAFLVSRALGWDLVPETVYRKKGPVGAGSVQWFIEHDPNYHYFHFSPADIQRLRPTVLFDLLINNADRKGSHVLKDPQDHLWLIDHGVSFHVEDKLRTVIWDFVGEPFPPQLCADLEKLKKALEDLNAPLDEFLSQLLTLISPAEVRALRRRATQLLAQPEFPAPDPDRRPFPWPQI